MFGIRMFLNGCILKWDLFCEVIWRKLEFENKILKKVWIKNIF